MYIRTRFARGCASSSSSSFVIVVVVVSCPPARWCAQLHGAKVAEVWRSYPRRREASRRSCAAEDSTITHLSRFSFSLPLPPSLSLACAPIYAHVRARAHRDVCECACVRRVGARCRRSKRCASAPLLAEGEESVVGEQQRGGRVLSVNGSHQDYAKSRKYEHCCPTGSRRVHWTKGKRLVLANLYLIFLSVFSFSFSVFPSPPLLQFQIAICNYTSLFRHKHSRTTFTRTRAHFFFFPNSFPTETSSRYIMFLFHVLTQHACINLRYIYKTVPI